MGALGAILEVLDKKTASAFTGLERFEAYMNGRAVEASRLAKLTFQGDPAARHYIVSIIVTENGAKAAEKTYTAQTDPTETHERFVLSGVQAGAIIEVAARCNVSGTLKQTITL